MAHPSTWNTGPGAPWPAGSARNASAAAVSAAERRGRRRGGRGPGGSRGSPGKTTGEIHQKHGDVWGKCKEMWNFWRKWWCLGDWSLGDFSWEWNHGKIQYAIYELIQENAHNGHIDEVIGPWIFSALASWTFESSTVQDLYVLVGLLYPNKSPWNPMIPPFFMDHFI